MARQATDWHRTQLQPLPQLDGLDGPPLDERRDPVGGPALGVAAMGTCFIAMPITTSARLAELYRDADHFTHVLRHLFVPAILGAGFEPLMPRIGAADLIHAEIFRSLTDADLVVADLSSLNPNVFFELGIRTALDRPVALVRDDRTADMPFDTQPINCYVYRSGMAVWDIAEEIAGLATHLAESARRSGGRNNLWRYFGPPRSGASVGDLTARNGVNTDS